MDSEPRQAAVGAPIEELLPHRPPFLFLDRVLECEDERVLTEWQVPVDLDCFRGHYPERPVLPGVILCEMAFQSGAVLLGSGARLKGALPVLATIRDARFKHSVAPGESLRAEVEIEERLSGATYLKGIIRSEGRAVLRLRFVLALAPLQAPLDSTAEPST